MNSVVKLEHKDVDAIPFQEASLDIWDKKYRLSAKDGTPVDKTMDDTYQRVARALAGVEPESIREHWNERFLWALRRGAIPAGRVTSNAGALEHKPATSTINCTVSGTIGDSMDDILNKVHEAGLTLKAGCGIGYEFSTLRPRGAYVSGAGAYTSGPLSFMDIYDKMCFTVSSAGGRRGAQMGTFDIGHPDALEFIRAKRENGRLRQFNLSLLITDEFMAAVRADKDWNLAFPLLTKEYDAEQHKLDDKSKFVWREWPATKNYVTREDGLVCCKIYKTLPARRMWDVIMSSTYDFAEPGFILIDRVNEMNNNWWCENIRATNPCVTADTWVQTGEGPRQVGELIGRQFQARVDGVDHLSSPEGFFRTAVKPLVNLTTTEGFSLRLTGDHRVRRVSTLTRWRLATEWCPAGDLKPGDKVLLQDHRRGAAWVGAHGTNEGYLMGLLVGDGHISEAGAELSVWARTAVGNSDIGMGGPNSVMATALDAARRLNHRAEFTGWHEVGRRGEFRLGLSAITELANDLGVRPGRQTVTPAIERGSSEFYRGFLRGLFDSEGSVQGTQAKGVSIRLGRSDTSMLEGVQRMLLRLGIAATIYRNRAQPGLVITGENVARFADIIGFADTVKRSRLAGLLGNYKRTLNRERFVATVDSIRGDGYEDVYDVQIPGVNEFDANGLHAHNCGEQPLPPYGSCLLGSVNLTRFVKNAFTDFAEFDWNEYRDVVKVFTRMLDNVVEVNGLPLEQQRNEIMRKRRHGMGFLGLGSTITCLGMKYGAEDSDQVHRRRLARDGGGRLGSRARSGQGEGPRAHHEGGVHRHRRDAAQAAGNGERRLEDGRPDSRAASCTRATAATCSAWPRPRPGWWTNSPTSARASRTTARSRPPARSRCRSRTMPATASSPRSRTTISATSFVPAKRRRRKLMSSHSSCWPIASSSIRVRCRIQRTRPNSCLAISPRRTTSRRRSTSTSRPQRRGGSTVPFPRQRTCLRITIRELQGHLSVRPREGSEGLHHVPLQPRSIPGRAGEGRRPQEHHLRVHARGRLGNFGEG